MDNEKDSVAVCMDFFQRGYPKSGPKNFRTQLGVHFEEIAEMMSCPIGTVRSRIYRAREAIATRLRPMLDARQGERW